MIRRGAYIIHKKPIGALFALKNSGRKVLFRIAAKRKQKRRQGQGIFMMITNRLKSTEIVINTAAGK